MQRTEIFMASTTIPTSFDPNHQTLMRLQIRLESALRLVKGVRDDPAMEFAQPAPSLREAHDTAERPEHVMKLTDLPNLALAHELLTGIRWFFPKTTTWCVVKHYADVKRADGSVGPISEPVVWVGCWRQEQAEELAFVLRQFYASSAATERWVVEEAAANLTQIVKPDTRGHDYDAYLRAHA